MKKYILSALLLAFLFSSCENETYIDHAFTGEIQQISNPDAPAIEDAVDLGLSVKWAPYNIGAKSPSDFGNYYSYGETSVKDSYSQNNYSAPTNTNTLGGISTTDNDAATILWGENWRMPTKAEIEELMSCACLESEMDGVKGIKITAINGNTLFLPASGLYMNEKLYELGTEGFYRCQDTESPKSKYFDISDFMYYGCSIRPVLSVAGEQAVEIQIPNEDEAIDLGLSVKWAPYNLGASDTHEYGNYYSFGEVETKTNYTQDNYSKPTDFNCEGGVETSKSDVATVKWGEKWRMPSQTEIDELFEKCKYNVKNYNGVSGYEFTGPNGNTMFLPFTGYCNDFTVAGRSEKTLYYRNYNESADDADAYKGFAVRPVYITKFEQNDSFPVPTAEESVNLGLSVNWAPYNVGASTETQTGNYYAWGETEYKDKYCQHTYTAPAELNAQGGISGTKYDVAHTKWGNGWRMPTAEEIDELWTKCIWSEETVDGVNGYRITALNGNSIFLPFGGIVNHTGMPTDKNNFAYYNNSSNTTVKHGKYQDFLPYFGALVRPVISVENDDEISSNIDIVNVVIEQERTSGYNREWLNNEWNHKVYVYCNLRIELALDGNVEGFSDYGIILYKNDEQLATFSHKDNIDFEYPNESVESNVVCAQTISQNNILINCIRSNNNDNFVLANTEGSISLSIKAIDKDFLFMYDSGYYSASIGKSLKYKTYFKKKDSNGNDVTHISDKFYPLDVKYTKQPSVKLKELTFEINEENGNVKYDYLYWVEREGAMFFDTLNTIRVFFVKEDSSYKLMKKQHYFTELLADGTIGHSTGSSYTLGEVFEYNYMLQYVEGILRQGNARDTFRTNPLVFDFNAKPYLNLTCEETWPEEFKFWENQ